MGGLPQLEHSMRGVPSSEVKSVPAKMEAMR